MADYQYPHNKRKEVEKFFQAPVMGGEPLGHTVTFLSYGIHIYTRTGLVFDKDYDGNGVAKYSIMDSSGSIYNGVKRHHIRGISDS